MEIYPSSQGEGEWYDPEEEEAAAAEEASRGRQPQQLSKVGGGGGGTQMQVWRPPQPEAAARGPPEAMTTAQQMCLLDAFRKDACFWWRWFDVKNMAERRHYLRYVLNHLTAVLEKKNYGDTQITPQRRELWEWVIASEDTVAQDYLWFLSLLTVWDLYRYFTGSPSGVVGVGGGGVGGGAAEAPPRCASVAWLDYWLRTSLPARFEDLLSGDFGSEAYPPEQKLQGFVRTLRTDLFATIGVAVPTAASIQERLLNSAGTDARPFHEPSTAARGPRR